MQMETMTTAMNRLRDAGYASDFSALADGALCCGSCEATCDAAEAVVDDVIRFEGTSDPGDSAILVALQCSSCGHDGLFVSGYGPETAPDDALALNRLAESR